MDATSDRGGTGRRPAAVVALCVALGAAWAGAAKAVETSVRFSDAGLSSLVVGGRELLADGASRVTGVRLTDRYRDKNAEDDERAHAGDDREFTDADVKPRRSSFDRAGRRLVREYAWGSLAVTYLPAPGRLGVAVDVTNSSDKVIEQVRLDIMRLALPDEVKVGRPHDGIGAPTVIEARYDGGIAVLVNDRVAKPLRLQLAGGKGKRTVRLEAGDAKGGREILDMKWNVRPIRPGGSDRYEVSLRFGGADADIAELASDVCAKFREAHPMLLRWPDRRPIGAVHVGDHRTTVANPRGWRHATPLPADWDVNAEGSIARFREIMLLSAERIIATARPMGLQGVIVWNIEGQQFQSSAYYGEPRLIEHLAPEMHAAADGFFRKLREAGLRVGACIRPTIIWPILKKYERVPWGEHKDIQHRPWLADDRSPLERLHKKIVYAKDRWGCTLFYVDTNHFWRPRDRSKEGWAWASKMLRAEVFEELCRRHPDCLVVPEHQCAEYWSAGGQYRQPPKWGGPTPALVRRIYPEALSVISMNDANHIAAEKERYVRAIVAGDVLLPAGWYGGNTKVLREVYGEAAAQAPFKVRLGADGGITVLTVEGGQRAKNAKALGKMVAKLVKGREALPDRRFFVTHAAATAPEALGAVLEAIADGGGFIAWTLAEGDE